MFTNYFSCTFCFILFAPGARAVLGRSCWNHVGADTPRPHGVCVHNSTARRVLPSTGVAFGCVGEASGSALSDTCTPGPAPATARHLSAPAVPPPTINTCEGTHLQRCRMLLHKLQQATSGVSVFDALSNVTKTSQRGQVHPARLHHNSRTAFASHPGSLAFMR